MWQQRIFGMEYCAAHGPELQLVCDDDIAFQPDFAERMIDIMQEYEADLVCPELEGYLQKETSPKQRLLSWYFRSGIMSESKSPYYVRVNSSAGFVKKDTRKSGETILPTQSDRFACFMAKSDVTKLRYMDERWIDETRYAIPDDQVFFYKAFLAGKKIFHCMSPRIRHLDHGSGAATRRRDSAYANARNFLIFWYRFLWTKTDSPWRRLQLLCGITYRIFAYGLFYTLFGIKNKSNFCRSYFSGLKDGIAHCRHTKCRTDK